ncbi:hypothetical protein NE235_16585 [Actinoallomurus spadix]|uniref:Uncharacterized protein n=1 Tax=Actinoallomurus spadix TaxID=79912 RepID=A0ABN0XCK8_9ACTN|nr:hypothetical protein [Actinoallomurus spadix]MCO5987721.1 hypothetical protein [Actinoallomurus spadix]
MILTSTYRDQTSLSRDLLAAFSALDHATTADLSPDTLAGALDRLLRRLAVLASLHGSAVPAQLLTALGGVDAGSVDPVDLAAAYLEHGTGTISGEASEIQQELVHFSRIVDIGQLGLQAGVDEHALRRLRGSDRLPDSLKVLSELVIVTRARLAQRGRLLPTPWLRPDPAAETDTGDVTIAAPPATPDYWMAVRCARRRLRRQFRYELSALLEYLTPVEAALALWAHAHEQQLPTGVDFLMVQADPCGVTAASWTYQPGTRPETDDIIGHVARQLPTITTLTTGQSTVVPMGEGAYRITADAFAAATVTDQTSNATAATLTAPPEIGTVTHQAMAEEARLLLSHYIGPELVSMEAGHIHLDRDLDIDQDTGAAIGAALMELLAARQTRPPVLTPMMDDDHVLVRLAPTTYRQFLQQTFGGAPMHLICESSPIIRAIVVALYQRLRNSKLGNRFDRRGGNLFLPLPDGSHCELFENIDGTPITGCVFFETALLTYRTAPARFDQYFAERYGLTVGVHEQAAQILSGDQPHDAKVAELGEYYRRYADITDPHRPDPHITALVADVLDQAAPVTAHLNVLEDYYEIQQGRVRQLLSLLGLPLRLVTVHFNAATGRVVLCDE